MSSFFIVGSVFIDNFVFGNTKNYYTGDDAKVEQFKFIGIKKLFDSEYKPFLYRESVSGIMGFGPPTEM